jgi:flagellar protein FlbD
MIPVRLLNGSELFINAELVESIAAAHDTIVTLTTGRKIVTSSRPEHLVEALLEYRRRIHERPQAFPISDSPFPISDPKTQSQISPARVPQE